MDDTVLVATIGATVAAATGATVLKIGFCLKQKDGLLSSQISRYFQAGAVTCAMVCGGWGFWAPIAGCDGSVIRVVESREVWGLTVGVVWIVRAGRLKESKNIYIVVTGSEPRPNEVSTLKGTYNSNNFK